MQTVYEHPSWILHNNVRGTVESELFDFNM